MSVKSIAVLLLLPSTALGWAGVARAAPLELGASLGFGKPAGEGADDFGIDVGGAVSGGSRVHPNFGVHLRLALDRLAPDDPPFGEASMWMVRGQVEPAAHVVRNRVDFSLGPTLGLYYLSGEADLPGPIDASGNSWGFTVGARVNLMFLVGSVAVGPFFAYDRLFPLESCVQVGMSDEVCDEDPDEDQGFWQLGVAATF